MSLKKCPFPGCNCVLSLYKENSVWKRKKAHTYGSAPSQLPALIQGPTSAIWLLASPVHRNCSEKVTNDVPIAKPKEHFQCGAFLQFKPALNSCFLLLQRYHCLCIVLPTPCLDSFCSVDPSCSKFSFRSVFPRLSQCSVSFHFIISSELP